MRVCESNFFGLMLPHHLRGNKLYCQGYSGSNVRNDAVDTFNPAKAMNNIRQGSHHFRYYYHLMVIERSFILA